MLCSAMAFDALLKKDLVSNRSLITFSIQARLNENSMRVLESKCFLTLGQDIIQRVLHMDKQEVERRFRWLENLEMMRKRDFSLD